MEKINVAELLKDCPKGMELDCTMFDDVKFIEIEDGNKPICIRTGDIYRYLTKFGTWTFDENAKCVIFPKGKTTWEGFQRPFKDGDILSYQCVGFKNRTIYIYMQHSRMNTTYYVALSGNSNSDFMVNDKEEHALNGYNDSVRFATEEEKEKLFQAIKDNGYKWNTETKTLEKLIEPKFEVGNIIQDVDRYKVKITEVNIEDEYYGYESITAKEVGIISFSKQDKWELVLNKFDISTLKPFESRVLVRDKDTDEWRGQFFSHYYKNSNGPYICIGLEGISEYCKCIPFEGNEHLLGTNDDCDEYYKTWE